MEYTEKIQLEIDNFAIEHKEKKGCDLYAVDAHEDGTLITCQKCGDSKVID